MNRPKFSIKSLLLITAIVCFVVTFMGQQGNWWVGLMLTILLGNVACVVVALAWFLLVPAAESTDRVSSLTDNCQPRHERGVD